MGGWVGIYYVFIYYIIFLNRSIFKIKFFGLPNILSNLIRKKTILWSCKKTTRVKLDMFKSTRLVHD